MVSPITAYRDMRALGLGKIGRSAEHTESDMLAGQLRHVAHLVKVEGKDA